MKDMQVRLEKLRTDAAECALIRDLATDPKKAGAVRETCGALDRARVEG